MALRVVFLLVGLTVPFLLSHSHVDAKLDYGVALTKSLLYFEAQRSGKLPPSQRVQWRADSALKDGSDVGVDLTGGYYDAGDNVKFGFPMAFTVTLLSWSVVEYGANLKAKNELLNALAAVRWGTDYLIKAHAAPEVLYVEVGDGDSDHDCWQRPEDMTTPRTSYRVDASHPGSDVAAETAAALTAASIALRGSDVQYASTLLDHAKQLFNFGRNHRGLYQNSVPVVQKYYPNNDDNDEMAWAAAWLYHATNDQTYLDFLSAGNNGGVRSGFSWYDKFVGAQTLISKLVSEGKVPNNGPWAQYKSNAEQFVCSVVQKGSNNVKLSPGGMLWWQPWNNFQYTTSAMLVLAVHADQLAAAGGTLQCPGGNVGPQDIISFIGSQVDYILGANPKKMSYMIGFGPSYPVQVHHRGASIVSIKSNGVFVSCKDGYSWFNRNEPNPNVIDGAIVGGPDDNDAYNDFRPNFQQGEATTYTTAPLVGVLARIA
ncbi:endoglucanase 13-like [Typha angustifolia]|uniref:endoglucanase 13-like n=1 Tax=Typha angustifolia TaxID=59011 RepID=UPI003C2CAC8B